MFIFVMTPRKKRLFLLCLVLLFTFFAFRGFIYRTFIQEKVQPDVYFLNINMGTLSQKDVEEIVAFHIGEWQVNPVDADYNEKEHTITPEIWGYRANVEKTVQKIFQASTGERVNLYLEIILPEISMNDYPSAVILRGNPVKESVAFMINVAWGTEHLIPLMDALASHDAKGSFFLVGKWAEENEPLVREIINQGHLVGNHGHTDVKVITEIDPDELREGLENFNVYLETLTKSPVSFFTPHKGEYNQHALEIISRLGMRTLLWSVDTIDWMEPGVDAMHARVLEKVHPGAIILMHPTRDTVIFVENILPALKKKGLSVVSVEELLNPDIFPEPLPGG